MSWNPRRASVVLLALIVAVSAVCLDQGRAQVQIAVQPPGGGPVPALPVPPPPDPNMNPDGFLNSGISLPKDEKGRASAIEAAIDYIREEEWKTAIPTLQKLLEIDEDVFVRLERTNAEGKKGHAWVSVKQEADRLLASLPPAGRDFYKLTHGAAAAKLLQKAKDNGDPSLLAEVMKRYAHTDAGGEAIKLLGRLPPRSRQLHRCCPLLRQTAQPRGRRQTAAGGAVQGRLRRPHGPSLGHGQPGHADHHQQDQRKRTVEAAPQPGPRGPTGTGRHAHPSPSWKNTSPGWNDRASVRTPPTPSSTEPRPIAPINSWAARPSCRRPGAKQ